MARHPTITASVLTMWAERPCVADLIDRLENGSSMSPSSDWEQVACRACVSPPP